MDICAGQTQKIRKTDQKFTFSVLWGGCKKIGKLKSSHKAYLKPYTTFQLPRGEIGEESLFESSDMGTPPISPLLTDLRGWFLDTLYNFWFSIDWYTYKKKTFAMFDVYLSVCLSPNLGIAEFLPKGIEMSK